MNLKELEKLAPKRGIGMKCISQSKLIKMHIYIYIYLFYLVLQSVKDVLQSLCDDNLVDFDKIGSANFHWALPSKAGNSVYIFDIYINI